MSDKQSQNPLPRRMNPAPLPKRPGEEKRAQVPHGNVKRDPQAISRNPVQTKTENKRSVVDETRVRQSEKPKTARVSQGAKPTAIKAGQGERPKAERSKLAESLKTIQLRKISRDDPKAHTEKDEPWYSEKVNGARIYQMTGFTTMEKIDRKFGFEQRQIILRKLIATLVIVLVVLIMLAKVVGRINPDEFKRITGRDENVESILNE